MDLQHLLAIALFALASTGTPGPNNLMLMSSGANVGFKRTIPHMLGIMVGFSVMLTLIGVGLVGVFHTYPASQTILKYLSLGYLAYLAFKIATSKGSNTEQSYKPMTFIQAAGFQWVNPKGWSMALTAVSLFNAEGGMLALMVIVAVFFCANIPSVALWTAAGTQLQRWLTTGIRIKVFNYGMAGLLLASAVPML
ncbi:transporter [Vibrio sp. JCM 19236]|nr:transporter [Vibrio sp. JCM 19236]